jgi:hypothetical protein
MYLFTATNIIYENKRSYKEKTVVAKFLSKRCHTASLMLNLSRTVVDSSLALQRKNNASLFCFK